MLKMYTVNEVAEMFRVTDQAIRRWVSLDELKCIKSEGKLLFTEDQINDYIEKHST